jgi:tetratricopeptide (TPR) repeat protein
MNNESYNRGIEKAKQKDYTGAIEEFTHALQLVPYFSEAYYRRGLSYFDLGEIHRAVSDFTEAINLTQSVEAYYGRALARVSLKNLPGALADAEQAIYHNINYAPAYNLRGTVLRKQGCIPDAIASFKKAAELYLDQKDTENCRQCLAKVRQLQPKDKPTLVTSPSPTIAPLKSESSYFIQLLDKAEKGNTRDAMEDLNWVLQADPKDAYAYCCRGVVRCKQGNYRDAISDFNQALQLNLQDAIVYRNRGKARFHLGDYTGAIADFNRALQKQPQDALLFVARGNAYREMGNHLGAIEDYTKALEINPDDATAYYNRGIAYTCLEEMHRAIEDYQRAASMYCEKEDWANYQQVLDSLKKINSFSSEPKKTTNNLQRQRLLRLVGGHWEIAERLLDQARYDYPGMPEDWYIEKVIHDLERDWDR